MRRILGSLAILALTACGSDGGKGETNDDSSHDGGTGADAGGESQASFALGVPCGDAADSLYGKPGTLPDEQGAILRCVDDGVLSKAQVQTLLDEMEVVTSYTPEGGVEETVTNTYQGPAALHGTHVYRVLYRTERGDGSPGYSVATMYVPDIQAESRLPLMLLARGSRGQAPGCAPSVTTPGEWTTVDSPDGRWVQPDLDGMLWSLVAGGFAVAVTDSAGYSDFRAEGNPPSAFADVQDMAKSFLDSGHALRKLLPDGTSDDVLMVGLSQGGHTVLGSLQVANDYPAPGRILGAAVYSPLWFAQRAWGLTLNGVAETVGGILLNQSSGVPGSIWYHYTHAELYDGPGEGTKLFKPEVRAAVEDFVDTVCWSETYQGLEDATRPLASSSDFFTAEMKEAISGAALSRSCEGSPDEALCEKWMGHYRDDHPVLTGAAAEIPVVMGYGMKDTTIPPARFKCAFDKLAESGNPVELCLDPMANHGGVVMNQSAFVNQWLLNKATGAPITATCPTTKMPADLSCDMFLPND